MIQQRLKALRSAIKRITPTQIILVFLFLFFAEPLISPSLIKIQGENKPQNKGSVVVRKILSRYTAYAGSSEGEGYVWPVRGRLSQYYHARHGGLDIALPTGNACVASRSGTVEYAGWSTGYGLNVLVNHGGGVKTRYAHFSQVLVKNGQIVGQGETLGKVGSTGWSTGPHVHFEIIENGRFINPLLRLR